MKVDLEARVPSDKEDTDFSISAQALEEYASRNGHEVVMPFVDQAESGRTADRPAFREMIALVRQKLPPFEATLVCKLNRVS